MASSEKGCHFQAPEERKGGRTQAGTIAPNGPALKLLTPSLFTSSSLKVEHMLTNCVVSGKNSGQQEACPGHRKAKVFYWPQCDWTSLSVQTLRRILWVGKVKKIFFLWSHYPKNKLTRAQQHLSILQDSVCDSPEANICL